MSETTAVLRLASEMARKLEANAHKGGWASCPLPYLTKRLSQEVAELKRAIRANKSREDVLAECADVANFAMMIADVYEPDAEHAK